MDRPAAGARTHVLRPPTARGTAAAARAALHRSGRAAAVCGAAAGAHATALHQSTASLHARCGTAIADLERPPALLLARRIQLDFEHTIAERCGRRLRVGAFGQRDRAVEAAVAPLAAVVAALIRRLLLLALALDDHRVLLDAHVHVVALDARQIRLDHQLAVTLEHLDV